MSADPDRTNRGPEFADPEPRASGRAAPDAEPAFVAPPVLTDRLTAASAPQFEDPNPEPELSPAGHPAGELPDDERRERSAAGKAIGWLVALAVLAILLGIFMPKERPTFSEQRPDQTPAAPPSASPVTPANRATMSTATTVAPVQPSQVPQPPPSITISPNALMSSEEVGQAIRAAGDTERAGRDQALGLMIAFLRQPQFQNPEDFAVLKAHLSTVGLSLIPGGATAGHQEIIAAINRGATGEDAAREIEAIGHQPALPAPVEQGLLAVLASATTLPEIMDGVDRVQADTGTRLSPETIEVIRRHAEQAQQNRANAPRR
ncbi:MAG: hypothetical protein KBI47_15255 [Armatimonadetes bacterium]|nr:hypothetical protein [Armatimonadota bacterium]